ncbi:unnamed protein product [Brachionus calyciflorus]|uniref:Uncharacterized protein n=1 Tax=Brachionus calyciflorus TaxID=104777 RepID=A0A814M8S8_9BILA|nr:unnamed protein product [Brachionus calyciflorus]
MMKFTASRQENTTVYGNDNLGLSLSGAFLMLTPQKEVSKFKNVEKRRGTVNYDSFKKCHDTFSNLINKSLQPAQFEAGLQEEEFSYISSIAVEEDCSCQNLSFNIKMASTPKPKKRIVSNCKELKIEKLLVKKRKLQKKKLDITTSTNINGCQANFLKFLKEKKSKDLGINSYKKSETKLKIKKTIEKIKSESKSSAGRKLNVNANFINQYGNFLLEQQMNDYNLINENNCSNNFNQFGQLKVWYV